MYSLGESNGYTPWSIGKPRLAVLLYSGHGSRWGVVPALVDPGTMLQGIDTSYHNQLSLINF